MESRLKEIARKAKNDYYFFCKEILGYQKMSPEPHKELCNFITNPKGKRKKIILLPRGSFKSSVVTVGHSIFSLAQDPNERILIAHEVQKLARKYVKEVRGHLEENQKFRAIFGDWVNQNNTWRDDEFIISKRTKLYKEPSVMAGSLEKGVTVGMHFSKIYLDDPVSINNSRTSDQVEKTIEYYRLLLSVLEPDGQLFICGTRWNTNDLYGFILDPKNYERDNFDVLIKRAVDEDGTLLMPKVLTKEFLEEVRKSQGEEIFNHQYLNNPLVSTTQTFEVSDLRYFDKPPLGLVYFITIDCAISLKKEADYTGIIVNGVDYDNNYYIHEAIQGKFKPFEIVEKIFELAQKYSPIMALGLETNSLDQVIKNILLEEMGKRKVFIPVVDVVIDPRIKKENRIKWLQVKFKNHQLFLRKDQEDLIAQIKFHPQIKHDDLLDALKSQMKITFPSDDKGSEIDKYSHLIDPQKKIWKHVEELGKKRMVRRKSRWSMA